MKNFALRVDVESQKGISEGLPKILDLLKEFGFKASFYVTIGGESNLFELFKYRDNVPTAGERQINIFSFAEKIRMALFPKDFVKDNMIIFERLLSEGHELGLHGWKHREWTRGLEKIDIKKRIGMSIDKYKKLFGRTPESFCSPGFNTNQEVINSLDSLGIKVVSDFPGTKPSKIDGTKMVNVPITIKGENNTPIIEYLFSKGMSDEEIFSYIKKQMDSENYSSIYIHDMFECIQKIDLLRSLFHYLKKEKIEMKTLLEISKKLN